MCVPFRVIYFEANFAVNNQTPEAMTINLILFSVKVLSLVFQAGTAENVSVS